MSWKNSILYILLVTAIAGISALTGAIAGGAVVYRALQQPVNLPAPIEAVLPSGATTPGRPLRSTYCLNSSPAIRSLWM